MPKASTPEPTLKHDPDHLQRLLCDLRADFNGLRQHERPIKITLIHLATNAEAEGVVTKHPSLTPKPCVAFLGAGHREARQNYGPEGQVRFIDPPVVDVHGRPIICPESGKGIDVTMPAFRNVMLAGEINAVERLQGLAERGGRLAATCRDNTLPLLAGWRFSGPEAFWWALVFELSWSGQHPLLSATRCLWHVSDKFELVRFPYDLEEVRRLAAFPLGAMGVVPEGWLKRLPEAYMSEINDAVSASRDAVDTLQMMEREGRSSAVASSAKDDGPIKTTDDDADAQLALDVGDHWAPYDEIKSLYGVSSGQLTKMANKNPKIRRAAKSEDREKWNKPKMMYMYDKRLIYEAKERDSDAE